MEVARFPMPREQGQSTFYTAAVLYDCAKSESHRQASLASVIGLKGIIGKSGRIRERSFNRHISILSVSNYSEFKNQFSEF
jgi:hypothetical protein